ncbi:DUF4440 domain-containing protein [Corallococcus sp. H22C18031201]|uniref:YybH family protein n=1 Tax=Citreicoccus inhibens TaxID=2849499 RepID=UPI000E74FD0B|nr:nuclear transport factor 2 family protein [Citreicoccus inhibens]MBU8894928.1 nuclear transport factor 2 family protein [Citreicoccus inhibens]RJS27092.1 DUF4440 domain-containing protein [Corallococcus sp. H22C18031201]
MHKRFLVVCCLSLLAACAPKRIPGTNISDTSETRAILQEMERYRAALEALDAKAIVALVSPKFHDDAGTEDPEDDLTYANLQPHLQALFQKIKDPKVEMNVRRVEFNDAGDVAAAVYYWKASWRLPGLTPRADQDSELKQMVFQRVDGQWKIVSGI